MKFRDFLKMIEAAGWSFVRHGGDHDIYGRGILRFSVPRHAMVPAGIVRSWKKVDEG